MNVRRMRLAIRILRALKPTKKHKFNMGRWYVHTPLFNKNRDPRTDVPSQCGTVACALGSLALDPRFQRLGLRVSYNRTDREIVDRFIKLRERRRSEPEDSVLFQSFYAPERFDMEDHGCESSVVFTKGAGPDKLFFDGVMGAAELFGITCHQAQLLFMPSGYPVPTKKITPKMVANKMEKMVEEHLQERE